MLREVWEFFIAFCVAPFPAAWKARWAEGRHDSAAAQIASGIAQFVLATILHFVGIILATGAFYEGPGVQLFEWMDRTNNNTDFNATGLGFIGGAGYMLSPVGLLVLYLLAEGIVRAIDPAITGQRPGTALIAGPAWLYGLALRHARERALRLQLGPDRPDEFTPPAAPGGPLWFYSVRLRELSPVQCASWRGAFYVLDGPGELVLRGEHRVFAFRFRPARPGEILRCAPWIVPES